MRRFRRLGVGLGVVGALALSPHAIANPLDIPTIVPPKFRTMVRSRLHMPAPHHRFEARFTVRLPRGYELSVAGTGEVVAIAITRPRRHSEGLHFLDVAATAYVVRGTVTPRRIAASFGKLGAINVHFKPDRRVVGASARRSCRRGRRVAGKAGAFVGSIRFESEDHHLDVRTHRARGRVVTHLSLDCKGRAARPPRGKVRERPVRDHGSSAFTFLLTGRRQALSSTELLALRGPRTTLYFVIAEESHGAMAELRYGLTIAAANLFAVNDALTVATIEPPPPFDGQGIYQAAPDGTKSWTGSLSAAFPGVPILPLTGDGFEATLGGGL